MNTKPTAHVEIVLDIACGASYLGYARFRRAAARYREAGGEIEVVFRPFQLVPDASAEGESLTEVHRRAFGPDVERSTARMTETSAREGVEFNYDRAVFTNTFEAHRIIAVAAGQGRAEEMTERLFHAYFRDGLNVGDTATLKKLAADSGVVWSEDGAEATRAALDEVRRSGLTSVPLFVVNGRQLAGAQPEQALLAALDAVEVVA